MVFLTLQNPLKLPYYSPFFFSSFLFVNMSPVIKTITEKPKPILYMTILLSKSLKKDVSTTPVKTYLETTLQI